MGNGYEIETEIADHASHKVGLRISGGAPGRESHIDLIGNRNNTFTGDVHISGHAGILLRKSKSATAVRGNIFVNDSGYLALCDSHQIEDTSTVTLDGRRGTASLIFHPAWNSYILESIHKLVVNRHALIDFRHNWIGGGLPHGPHYLYLDDLEVTAGSDLLIQKWELGRDHLLVRKNSAHLPDSLNRIHFEGKPAGWHAELKDYDKDYWQLIPAFPEPATYGAILGAAALGLWIWRKRRAAAMRPAGARQ